MNQVLKNIDELWSELAIKLEESKAQKGLNQITKQLSKYAYRSMSSELRMTNTTSKIAGRRGRKDQCHA